ncbi:hypothetical protein CkaCkLH20_03342 [Colletotrichum karsti]|uniref:Peptidase S54 rhomboid domain-containing protein n=1 Tax=Colletotrichum karsti TaxID=1095194 RepID=A0A9P6IAA4_9PEZI|nr:uncharacterized protein CkaCkLH20_03342 [Colletotrichum karsti]KAF9879109.1 hypothetical protein CkaCkLH20_03342 [Colletotrichum karsti]
MNTSLALVPSRSLLQLGLRAACRRVTTSESLSGASPFRFISTSPRTTRPPSSWSSPLRHNLWPSPAARALQTRQASSSSSESVLREYEDLPIDYKDKEGLPFRKTDLDAAEARKIFGSSLRPQAANRLLRILHGRRVAGTLDDPVFTVNTASYSPQQRAAALEYLRETVPVDEVLNAGLRAEDELLQLEAEGVAVSGSEESSAATTTPEKPAKNAETEAEAKPDPVYGYSVMDAIRAKNIAKNKAEEERLAREAEQKGLAAPGTVAALPIKRPPMTARMQKWMAEGGSDLEAPPPLTTAERILPSAAVVALLVGALAALAMVYSPPREADRMFPEVSASTATVGALVLLNALVFLAWKAPPLWRLLNTHFTLVHGMPRAASMLTANFSHQGLWHLLPNMVGLWFVGTALHDEVGRAAFLAIYLSSGAAGLLGSLVFFTLRGVLTVSTMGASGGVFGVATAYFWLHRFDSFKVLGLPPDPMNGPQGLGFIALILGVHIFAIFRRGKQTIDLASHLCGMLAGMIGIELVTGRRGEVEKSREDLVKDAPAPSSADDVKA